MAPIRKKTKPYRNPIAVALGFKVDLDNGKYRNQTALAKALNYTPARISQYLRLLQLPVEIRESVIRMGELSSPRQVTERRLRTVLSSARKN